jgi:crotonobetainyl-CoA:carnitine CoA-transferase CaiB-like acyl-CoA transferase
VFVDLTDSVPTRCGSYITGRAVSGARFRAFWPCADGYLNFVLYGGPAGRRSNEQLIAWMRERGAQLGPWAAIDIARFDPKLLAQEDVDRLEAPVARFFATLTKREFLEGASAREMLGYPVSTVSDIAADPQLAARGFFTDLRARDGSIERHCGAFAVVDGKRAPPRHAPGATIGIFDLLTQWSGAEQCALEPTA